MLFAIFVFIVIGVLLVFISIYSMSCSEGLTLRDLTCLFLGTFIIIFSIICGRNPNPTAMDVYQGKTTLEITYRDNIPIDSVVVFK